MPPSSIFFITAKKDQHEVPVPQELFPEDRRSQVLSTPKQKVLIADDDDYVRRMITELLRMDGYEVTEAFNGRQALAQARELKPDIVVTEVVMPEMDGLQLIPELLQLNPQTAIVAVSGNFLAETYLRVASALGAKATLFKPLTGEALLATVRQVSNGKG
jgi:CheY-like chemotaxis protein